MKVFLTVFGKPRYLGLIEIPFPVLVPGEPVVVGTTRGEEIAIVGGEISGEQAEVYLKNNEEGPKDGIPGGDPGFQSVSFIRQATDEDIVFNRESRELEESVLIKSRQILAEHSLGMKIVDVEYLLDRKKLFFYFTSEQRVDFRSYVRDLAREFRTRIELRQIGVRDEAKVVKGIAPCGRPCCCSYWLHNFLPIGIKMVKEQNLALNPTKISGLCGRLMCCMSYEHHVYRDLWKKLPNPGSKIKGLQGNFIMVGVDIKEGNVLLRSPEGSYFSIKVDDFPALKEKISTGEDWQSFVDRTENAVDASSSSSKNSDRKKAQPVAKARVSEEEKTEGEQVLSSEEDGSKKTPSKRRRRKKKKIEGGEGISGALIDGSRPKQTVPAPSSPQNQVQDGENHLPSPKKRKRRRPAKKREDLIPKGGAED